MIYFDLFQKEIAFPTPGGRQLNFHHYTSLPSRNLVIWDHLSPNFLPPALDNVGAKMAVPSRKLKVMRYQVHVSGNKLRCLPLRDADIF